MKNAIFNLHEHEAIWRFGLLADDSHVLSYLIFVENLERCLKICCLLQSLLALFATDLVCLLRNEKYKAN